MRDSLKTCCESICAHILRDTASIFRPSGGPFREPFLAPGSKLYQDCVWDWDSWMADVALRQAVLESGDPGLREAAVLHGRGSIINLLAHADSRGWVPICIYRDAEWWRTAGDDTNMASWMMPASWRSERSASSGRTWNAPAPSMNTTTRTPDRASSAPVSKTGIFWRSI